MAIERDELEALENSIRNNKSYDRFFEEMKPVDSKPVKDECNNRVDRIGGFDSRFEEMTKRYNLVSNPVIEKVEKRLDTLDGRVLDMFECNVFPVFRKLGLGFEYDIDNNLLLINSCMQPMSHKEGSFSVDVRHNRIEYGTVSDSMIVTPSTLRYKNGKLKADFLYNKFMFSDLVSDLEVFPTSLSYKAGLDDINIDSSNISINTHKRDCQSTATPKGYLAEMKSKFPNLFMKTKLSYENHMR